MLYKMAATVCPVASDNPVVGISDHILLGIHFGSIASLHRLVQFEVKRKKIGMRNTCCLRAIAVMAFTISGSWADQILTVDDALGNLGTVDVQTGAAHVTGNMGVIMTDIAFSPTGVLYGLSFTDLYTINPATAAATLIGPHSIPEGNALVFDASGTLYGAGGGAASLYTINPATGASSIIGSDGFGSAGDLAFNGGTLFFSSLENELVRISLNSPVTATVVGPLGFPSVFGLATGSDGVLYGLSGTEIFSVNTTTGAGTFLTNYFGQGLGVANGSSFITEAGAGAPAVPEPATAVLMTAALIAMLSWKIVKSCYGGFLRSDR